MNIADSEFDESEMLAYYNSPEYIGSPEYLRRSRH